MFSLATYIRIFSLFFKVVYPVGVTEVRLYFMYKIAYTSLYVEQIYPQIDTSISI